MKTPKKLNEELIKILFSYWMGKLNINVFPIFRRLYEKKTISQVQFVDESFKQAYISYNLKEFRLIPTSVGLGAIFHELGHLKFKHADKLSKIQQEYIAEKFALKCIKKYYPSLYKEFVLCGKKWLANKKNKKRLPLYYKTYSRIKEYK